ncbi:MAG: radical SAM family heme chaperone HemW [Raoultibacter sp.]|jgi:oxygen-independent coproporphyrinogen-3 oxidase
MYDPYKALYIHIPFCKQRCTYCDFSTRAVAQDSVLIDEYIEKLILDIRRASKEEKLGSLETVYLGGGTPSYIGQARLSSLLYALSTSMHLTPEIECSMEANPDSVTDTLIKDIWALGVNRLSIGVQSFDDELLALLGRAHSAEQARSAVKIAQSRFENISVDLMCGIPGQSFESFQASLEEAIALGVKHISVYPLAVEEHTVLERMIESGELEEPDQDSQALMMQMAASILEPAGLVRYEVASYAAQGFECRHNIAYWTGKPYLGFGTSAVTMTQNDARRMRVQDGQVIEDLDRRQKIAEDLMMSMRMTEGVSEADVHEATMLLPDAPLTFRELVQRGFVERSEGRYRPTLAGWLCGNELYGAIFNLAP